MKEVLEIVEGPYSLKNELKLKSRKNHSVRYGIKIASFFGARVWNSSIIVTLKSVNHIDLECLRRSESHKTAFYQSQQLR